jgi:hypothetical protein
MEIESRKLILDSDGDRFLLLSIFDRTPVSRDVDCRNLAKISEILAGGDICRRQYFVIFLHGETVQIGLYSEGESSPMKVEWQAATSHLVTA